VSNKSKIIAAAQKYAGKGNFEKAIAEYQKVLKLDPHDIRTWLKMGDLYTRMGARSEATDTYLKVAEQYRKSGFHLKAVAVYKQILKLDPLLSDVYELLGDAYLSLGLTSEALIQFEQLADIAARQNKQHIVAGTLRRILELDPSNISTRLRVAEQLSSLGETGDAIEQFRTACEQLKSQDRLDDYLKVAERLLYHDSSQLDIARDLAQIYLEQNEPRRALSKLQICFNANRKDTLTLEMLAAAFSMLQQPQKAISVYTELMNIAIESNNIAQKHGYAKSILKLDPEHRIARRELGSNVTDPASENYSATTSRTPSGPEAVVAKLMDEADVLVKYGLLERATEHFDKIFTLDFYNLEARERFKDLLLENGNMEGAKEQLFILVDAFIETQPEGAVYYLHEILRIDPMSRRARAALRDIGGVMPDGLPDLPHEESPEQSGLLEMEPVEISEAATEETKNTAEYDIDIADLPYMDDDNVLIEDSRADITILEDEDVSAVADDLPSRPSSMPADVSETPNTEPTRPERAEVSPHSAQSESPGLGGSTDSTRPVSCVPDRGETAAGQADSLTNDETSNTALADIDEELDEIAFFLEQGLIEEARGIYAELIETYPDDPRLLDLSTRFEEAAALSDESDELSEEIIIEEASGQLDIDELSSDLNLDELANPQSDVAVDTVFTIFKEGVKRQISKSDYNTHFDLGQAYKEMGLWDDAIGEFKIAAGDPEKAGTAEMLVGMCHLGAGRLEEAIATFDEARNVPGQSESELLALKYEKAKVLELMEQNDKALVIYREILNVDPEFADVGERIESLE
jgi:pilus assembly protein FimV